MPWAHSMPSKLPEPTRIQTSQKAKNPELSRTSQLLLSWLTRRGVDTSFWSTLLWGGSSDSQVGGVQTKGCEAAVLHFGNTCTNHRNRGRTSADRSTKATLMLTVPRSLIKSSTKDLTWPSLEIVFWHTYPFRGQRCRGGVLIHDYCYSGNSGQGGYHRFQHGFWLRGVQS